MAAPLGTFIRDLGLAVAEANQALANVKPPAPGTPTTPGIVTINAAEIEVNVAISIASSKDTSIGGSLGLSAFSVNAAYKSTYAFKEDASSRIKVSLAVKPRDAEPQA